MICLANNTSISRPRSSWRRWRLPVERAARSMPLIHGTVVLWQQQKGDSSRTNLIEYGLVFLMNPNKKFSNVCILRNFVSISDLLQVRLRRLWRERKQLHGSVGLPTRLRSSHWQIKAGELESNRVCGYFSITDYYSVKLTNNTDPSSYFFICFAWIGVSAFEAWAFCSIDTPSQDITYCITLKHKITFL